MICFWSRSPPWFVLLFDYDFSDGAKDCDDEDNDPECDDLDPLNHDDDVENKEQSY